MRETDVQVFCGCSQTDIVCAQDKDSLIRQCVITIPEDDLFRIVMELPEFKRRYIVNSRDSEVPASDETSVEQAIQDKGLNAPRLNPEQIDATIVDESYHVFPGTTMTVCCLTLENGFNVVGESAAASPENFDEEIGRTIARRNARDKIWSLEGYLLKTRLHRPTVHELEEILAQEEES